MNLKSKFVEIIEWAIKIYFFTFRVRFWFYVTKKKPKKPKGVLRGPNFAENFGKFSIYYRKSCSRPLEFIFGSLFSIFQSFKLSSIWSLWVFLFVCFVTRFKWESWSYNKNEIKIEPKSKFDNFNIYSNRFKYHVSTKYNTVWTRVNFANFQHFNTP